MTHALLERLLLERSEAALVFDDPQLQAVQQAILVEDVLGVVLTDDQIEAGVLDDAEALRMLVVRSTGTYQCAESAG